MGQVDQLSLAKYLVYPSPSYVSFQSALFQHGVLTAEPRDPRDSLQTRPNSLQKTVKGRHLPLVLA